MSYLNKKTIEDVDVKGKKVVVRVDFNVPVKDGVITDDTRISAELPTLNYLLEHGAALILLSHLGRPKGRPDRRYTLRPVAARLSELLGRPVRFIPDCIGPMVKPAVLSAKPGDVLLLENVRFHPEEEKNAPVFAAALASGADLYVDDAFGTVHRAHASTVGICRYLPSASGFLIDDELQDLGRLLSNPERPFVAIVGGAKVSDKIKVLENLLTKVDKLLLGGGMANTFLAAQGYQMEDSLVEVEELDWARTFLQTEAAQAKLVLPVDLVAAERFEADAAHRTVAVDAIPADWQALDVGPATCQLFAAAIAPARTVFWNGPLGVFEMDAFAAGTLFIANAVADSQAFTLVGGGDSVAAVKKAGVAQRIGHISTGGGASLEFLEGRMLPGIAALEDKE